MYLLLKNEYGNYFYGDENMAFIIDRYNKYNVWDREHSRKAFEINENWYAVYEVELEWGLP